MLSGWAAFLVLGWLWHPVSLDLHEESRGQVMEAWSAIRTRILEAPPDTTVYLEARSIRAFGALPNTLLMLPGWPGLFAIMEPTDVYDRRQVRFVAPTIGMLRCHTNTAEGARPSAMSA